MSQKLTREAESLLPEMVTLRRDLHACPELGNTLPQTRARVLADLETLDLEFRLSEKTSSFVATLKGARPGASVLLRADMDALPMPEDTGLEFSSRQDGAMHACGHDAHTAMLVGAARLLSARRSDLAGQVQFFFQSGEEGHFGAKICLAEGLLDEGPEPAMAFALHVETRLPVGRLASRPGPLMASADVWTIEVKGQGGHASMPHDARDPIPAACEIVNALQTMLTREIHAHDPVVISTTKIRAGTTNNVIPESAYLMGTLRATSEHGRRLAEEGIHRVAHGVSVAHGVEAIVNIEHGYPVTVNDPNAVTRAQRVASGLLSEEAFIEMPHPVMGAEDFSYVLDRWPGAMLFIGVRPEAVENPHPVHSNRMLLNESALSIGAALHAGVALDVLSDPAVAMRPA